MKYKVGISNPKDHFILLEAKIKTQNNASLELQLPAWRPGRYELANYAKNVRCFVVTNKEGNELPFQKISKDRWLVRTENQEEIVVQYEYYANQADAGASYVSEDLMYLNPVNCFMYVVGREMESFDISLNIPDDWQIACQLPHVHKTLQAKNFDELADSPFFASPNLQHHSFVWQDSNIHFWFQGAEWPQMERLERDTRLYLDAQVKIFGDLPLKDYHFLYLLLPNTFRHGVEHADSTVIAMGPASLAKEEDFYNDFLAISSHELFHLWNIKRIRPKEMWPYDFTKENYSQLGYIYEGITTYYGDLMLMRAGVWSFEQYARSLASDLDRHYNNSGRNNYSVAASSFDTWLDGYTPGVKGRKVSIYIEGLIAALVADVALLENSSGLLRLDQVMRKMYQSSYLDGKGYDEALYKDILQGMSAWQVDVYFKDLIHGKGNWDAYLLPALEKLGLALFQTTDGEGIVRCSIVKLAQSTPEQIRLFDYWAKCH